MNMKDVLLGVAITVTIAFIFILFSPEITALSEVMRGNSFESFMVIGVGILISISLYGTFFKGIS